MQEGISVPFYGPQRALFSLLWLDTTCRAPNQTALGLRFKGLLKRVRPVAVDSPKLSCSLELADKSRC